jgi:hypothetical protein
MGLTTILSYCQTVAGMLMWGALSDERTGLPFKITAGSRHRSQHLYFSMLIRGRDVFTEPLPRNEYCLRTVR